MDFESIIIGENRHKFIYGYNGKKRKKFLTEITNNNKVVFDSDAPVGVYMDEFSLPDIDDYNCKADKFQLEIFNREYLKNSIMYNLVFKLVNDIDISMINNRAMILLDNINRINKYSESNSEEIKSIDDLLQLLYEIRDFYKVEYDKLIKTGFVENYSKLQLSTLDLSFFMRYYKEMINTKASFALIFDQQQPIPIKGQLTINSLISRRINSDISINVVCDPKEWFAYYDSAGNLIENVHDFNIVDLDGSYKSLCKK